ncbi:MAG: N-acetyl sugar amidotransferase [Thermoplasmata archaeon]
MIIKRKVCLRCIMDTTAEGIVFDDKGQCNYCTKFLNLLKKYKPLSREMQQKKLSLLIEKVKRDGRNKPYDCIVGVSGGVDSSYALHITKKFGLRPLAVHMDNGWDSELAQQNIEHLVKGLGVDLYTYVIDWDEYRSLMQAFFDADVIDVELLYDNALSAVVHMMAKKYGIEYILAGSNTMTEGMSIPPNWNWFKFDKKNIYAIAKQFGDIKIKSFPAIAHREKLYYSYIRKIKWISFLDYFEYNKFEALKILQSQYNYKPYPYKHYESVFTRFYQGYILPQKFGVDKRKLHLSTLIISGQMLREEAIKMMENIPYPSQSDLDEDITYFLKKMRWNKTDLEEYLSRPEKSHLLYGSEMRLFDFLRKMKRRYSCYRVRK